MLILNNTLNALVLSCNKMGEVCYVLFIHSTQDHVMIMWSQVGGRELQEGMEENKTMLQLDLRLTDISQENEYYINQVIKNNNDSFES